MVSNGVFNHSIEAERIEKKGGRGRSGRRGGEGRGPVLPNSRMTRYKELESKLASKKRGERRGEGKKRRKVETGLLANAFVGCWPGSRRSSASRKD